MATSFLGLLALAITGGAFYNFFNRRVSWVLSPSLEIGSGYFLSCAIATIIFDSQILPISQSSDLIFLVCVTISALLLVHRYAAIRSAAFALTKTAQISRPVQFLLLVVSAYLILTLANNLLRDVLPWDAFTTWMYRAKAWVMNDRAVTFVAVNHWIESTATGYTLAASHYPISVSAIAAFSSSLSGGWNDQAASLPWFFASLSSVLLMIGLCEHQHRGSKVVSITGGALLATVPISHLHGMLAGYADIWIMGTSGMGLAGVCIWTQQRTPNLLFLSTLLLLLGCFWKHEGWLWLVLGLFTIATHLLWQSLGKRLLGLVCAVLVLGLILQPFNLGAFGTWGVSLEEIKLGKLARVDLTPYNPTGDYFRATALQGNFLLIFPLYLFTTLYILISNPRRFSGYLLIGLGIVASHIVIFGLSSYSEYARIGTAINRLLLQTLPVFVITITAALKAHASETEILPIQSGLKQKLQVQDGFLPAILAILLAFPVTIFFLSPTIKNAASSGESHLASEMIPAMGELVEGLNGYQFRGHGLPIGVARAPMRSPSAPQPRYVVTSIKMDSPETVAFYWINTDTPQVHSTAIMSSGASIIDMAAYPDYWERSIKELGYLVPPQSFQTTAIKSLSLTNSLFSAAPALINHWITPEPLSQRLINMTRGHVKAPINLQGWLTVSFILILISFAAWAICFSGKREQAINIILCATGTIWLIGSAAHLNQALALTAPLLDGSKQHSSIISADGSHLHKISALTAESHLPADSPVLTVSLDEQNRFDAENLPFLLLPLRAASISKDQLANIRQSAKATVIMVGQNETQIDENAKRFINANGGELLHRGKGYAIISAGRN